MGQDESLDMALWSLKTAIDRLNDGNHLRAFVLVAEALSLCYSLWNRAEERDQEELKRGFMRAAEGLSRMHPTVLRQAVRILDERCPPGGR